MSARSGPTVRLTSEGHDTGPIPVEEFHERLNRMTGEIRQGVLPTFEGLVVSAFDVSFGGKVSLSDFEPDMAVRNTLRLGQRVRLVVEGTVVAVPHTFKEAAKRGEDDTVTRGARVTVDTVAME